MPSAPTTTDIMKAVESVSSTLSAFYEHQMRFNEFAVDKFEAIHQRFELIEKRLDKMDQRFEAIDERFIALEERLNERMDMRFAEFTTILKKYSADVDARITKNETGIRLLTTAQKATEKRLTKIEKTVAKPIRKAA